MGRTPFDRAVAAAAKAMSGSCGCDEHDISHDARLAVEAAYPHLVGQTLRHVQQMGDELSGLRVVANEKYAEMTEWRDIADELAAALRQVSDPANEWAPRRAALARYDRAKP